MADRGALHHLEIWVRDLEPSLPGWAWLLGELGYLPFQEWAQGRSWRLGDVYVVVESGPDVVAVPHERRRPGLNHVAFHGGTRAQVDALVAACTAHGWTPMLADRYPHAGGPDHYAAYLEDAAGFEVEIVAAT